MNILSDISSSLSTGTAKLFSVLANPQAQRENLATNALSRGVDRYQKGEYEAAATEFRRAVGLAPYADTATQAYDYLATAYLKDNRTDEAIRAYKSALQLDPNQDAPHLKLGNIYFSEGRYDEAVSEYAAAAKLQPTSTEYLYSLGQAYLASGRYDEAEKQFSEVVKLAPENYGGYYGLGQTYRQAGRLDDSIEQLQKAASMKDGFDYGTLELGFAYADAGDSASALQQADLLSGRNSSLEQSLRDYIYAGSRPKILFVTATEAFDPTLGPGTKLSDISAGLAEPGASESFSFTFYFNKSMDRASVEDLYNWKIGRSTNQSTGGPYNWGLSIPETEVTPYPYPSSVIYDDTTFSARVNFSLEQNDNGDGTIDPSHLVFSFNGKDIYGKTMDTAADDYIGIDLIA